MPACRRPYRGVSACSRMCVHAERFGRGICIVQWSDGLAGMAPGRAEIMTSVIVGGARTPMGRLLGNLKDFPATRLGAVAIKAALDRSGVPADAVEYVIMGQVLVAGAGQMPARQA